MLKKYTHTHKNLSPIVLSLLFPFIVIINIWYSPYFLYKHQQCHFNVPFNTYCNKKVPRHILVESYDRHNKDTFYGMNFFFNTYFLWFFSINFYYNIRFFPHSLSVYYTWKFKQQRYYYWRKLFLVLIFYFYDYTRKKKYIWDIIVVTFAF